MLGISSSFINVPLKDQQISQKQPLFVCKYVITLSSLGLVAVQTTIKSQKRGGSLDSSHNCATLSSAVLKRRQG